MKRFAQQFSNMRSFVFVLMLSAFLLIGCAPAYASAASANSSPCSAASANMYTSDNNYPQLQNRPAKAIASQIYALAGTRPDIARREAIRFLEYETGRWSDVKYLSVKGEPVIRAIVTFISPGLVRAVVLNALISNPSTFNLTDPGLLDQYTNQALGTLGSKNDFALLILIQTKPDDPNAPKSFKLAAEEMTLHDSFGRQVIKTRADDFLNLPLQFSEKGYSGIIFYPLAIQSDGQPCSSMLDQLSETSLTLMTSSVKSDVAAVDQQSLYWSIVFPLLADLNPQPFVVNTAEISPADGMPVTLSKDPPSAVGFKPSENIDWRQMGLFVWWKLTVDHIPVQ